MKAKQFNVVLTSTNHKNWLKINLNGKEIAKINLSGKNFQERQNIQSLFVKALDQI